MSKVDLKKEKSPETWVDKTRLWQADAPFAPGLLIFVGVFTLLEMMAFFTLRSGFADDLFWLSDAGIVIVYLILFFVIGNVFFTMLAVLLDQQIIFNVTFAATLLLGCALAFSLDDGWDPNPVFVSMMMFTEFAVAVSPLMFFRLIAGLRVTAKPAELIRRRSLSIAAIFGAMIVVAALLGLVIWLGDQVSHSHDVSQRRQFFVFFGIAATFIFVVGLLLFPLLAVGLRLRFSAELFFGLMATYIGLPSFLIITWILSISRGNVEAEAIFAAVMVFVVGVGTFSGFTLITRWLGFRLLIPPITQKSSLEHAGKSDGEDPFADEDDPFA